MGEILNTGEVKVERYDDLNYKVYTWNTWIDRKTGKEKSGWKRYGYYGKIEHVIKCLIDLHIVDIEGETLDENLKSIQRQIAYTEQSILEALKNE